MSDHPPTEHAARSGDKLWWIVGGLGGVVVILAIVLVVVLLSGGGNDQPRVVGPTGTTSGSFSSDAVGSDGATAAPTTIAATTTSTTTAATTTMPVDPEAAAEAEMTSIAAADRSRVEELVGFWVPQLSSKERGIADENFKQWSSAEILDNFHDYQDAYGDPLLIRSSDFSNFYSGYWVVVIPETYSSPDGALTWCSDHQIDWHNCLAKRIGHEGDTDNTTELQPH